MAPGAGLEPATIRLTAGRSTFELPRNGEFIRWSRRVLSLQRDLRIVGREGHGNIPIYTAKIWEASGSSRRLPSESL